MTDGDALRQLIRLIGDDAHALTFQTFGQYRAALLKAGVALLKQAEGAAQGKPS